MPQQFLQVMRKQTQTYNTYVVQGLKKKVYSNMCTSWVWFLDLVNHILVVRRYWNVFMRLHGLWKVDCCGEATTGPLLKNFVVSLQKPIYNMESISTTYKHMESLFFI